MDLLVIAYSLLFYAVGCWLKNSQLWLVISVAGTIGAAIWAQRYNKAEGDRYDKRG